MSTADLAAERPTLWPRLADDEGYSDLIVTVAMVTLAGIVAAAIVALQNGAGAWAGALRTALDNAFKKAAG